MISNHRSCFVTEEGADVVSGFPGLGGCEADSENSEGMVAVGTVVEAVGGFDSAADWCSEAEGVQVEVVADGKGGGSDGNGFTADWCSEAEGVQVEVVADGKGGGFDGNGFEAGWRFEAESVQHEDAIIGTCGLGGRDFAVGQEEMEVPGTMGSVHGKKVVPIRLTHPPYVICRRTISLLRPRLGVFHLSGRPLGSGVHLVGLGVGRLHVCRVRRVVPGCGLFAYGSLCMTCDSHGVVNSGTGNSIPNLRVVRRPERSGRNKDVRAGSGIQVGSPILDNASGDAGLADYQRWAPRRWPIEGWECRVIWSPYVEKVRFFLGREVRGCVNQAAVC